MKTAKMFFIATLMLVVFFSNLTNVGAQVTTAAAQKQLVITEYSITPLGNGFVFYWETNKPSYGSVLVLYALDGVGYIDSTKNGSAKYGTKHTVFVQGFGISYTIEAHNADGNSVVEGTF